VSIELSRLGKMLRRFDGMAGNWGASAVLRGLRQQELAADSCFQCKYQIVIAT
jgi:hypothetical protein